MSATDPSLSGRPSKDRPTPEKKEEKNSLPDLKSPAEEGSPEAPAELTPEQQLEAYEKSLKEDDWGHQPC